MKLPEITKEDKYFVVRDDKFQGGTKGRVLPEILENYLESEFVYASPVFGYAQIALAYTAQKLGKKATIFVAKRKQLHPRTQEAKQAGAKIVQIPFGYLSNVQAKAKSYCLDTGAAYLPYGLDFPEMREKLTNLALQLDIKPTEVWSVAGSGTLTRALQSAWGAAKFYAVRIGSLPESGRALLYQAPEKFEQDAKVSPPFQSCSNYDAKAWRFVKQFASEGALFWNVAA